MRVRFHGRLFVAGERVALGRRQFGLACVRVCVCRGGGGGGDGWINTEDRGLKMFCAL